MSLFYPLPQTFPITQRYGENPGNYNRWNLKAHNGIDFAAPSGTPVLAAADGWVEKSELDESGYGNYVQIRHIARGLRSVYAHLSRLDVKAGTAVRAGQVVGLSGSTGNSTGPHLHFEVRKDGQEKNGYGGAIDPSWLLDWPGAIETPAVPAGKVRVTASRLNLRLAPGLDQPIVGSLPAGVTVDRVAAPMVAGEDQADWIPVVVWMAKSFKGQVLAVEGLHD